MFSQFDEESPEPKRPKEEENAMHWKVILVLAAIEIVYVIIGGVAFHFIERPNEDSVRINTRSFSNEFLKNYTCISQADLEKLVRTIITAYDQGVISTNTTDSGSNWDIPSAIFFSTTVITTIGYGHISPSTDGGKAFCVIYALIGIPINLALLAGIGEKMARVNERLKNAKKLKDKPKASKAVRLVVCVGIGCVALIFIPAAIFSSIEDWDYDTSLYYALITLTTIGFGDYVAGLEYKGSLRGLYRITITLWIITGLAWVAWLIGDATELSQSLLAKVGHKDAEGKEDEEEGKGGKDKSVQGEKQGKTNEVMMSSMADK